MSFKAFSIPPLPSERTTEGKARCNARIWVDGKENYCTEESNNLGRCPDHNAYEKLRTAREEARLRRVTDPTSVGERVAELQKDQRNLTRLDELVYNSLATLQELEKRFPLATVSPGDAISISKLRKEHAALVHERVDLEIKLKTLLDSDFIYETAAKLFEKNITDKNTKRILMEGIGNLLDSLVHSGNATPHDDSRQVDIPGTTLTPSDTP